MNFGKIKIEYKPQNEKGTLGEAVIANWDLGKNKAGWRAARPGARHDLSDWPRLAGPLLVRMSDATGASRGPARRRSGIRERQQAHDVDLRPSERDSGPPRQRVRGRRVLVQPVAVRLAIRRPAPTCRPARRHTRSPVAGSRRA